MSYLINGPIDIKDNSNTNQAKINVYNPTGTFYVSLIAPSLSSSFNFSFPITSGTTDPETLSLILYNPGSGITYLYNFIVGP
jgi:hypothetical protein